MSNIAQFADSAAATTTLLDAAAALETRLHNAELRVRTLQRELRHAQQRQIQARGWIRAIRRCHRVPSHAATGRLIREALTSLDRAVPVLTATTKETHHAQLS